MSLEINSDVTASSYVNSASSTVASAKTDSDKKADTVNKATEANETVQSGVTYEKTEGNSSATYKINKMSAEDRKALVNQLKADQEQRKSQLTDLVHKMLGQQATTFNNANDIWHILSSGDFTVDPETKAQAQADIAEDGYWGVAQTSQRLFDFASALAGDDVDKMKEMQDAMMKGFKMATKTWGKELPQISQDTIAAANKLFDDYYQSKSVEA